MNSNVTQLVKKFLSIFRNRKVQRLIHKSLLLVFIPSHPVHSSPLHPICLRSILILFSRLFLVIFFMHTSFPPLPTRLKLLDLFAVTTLGEE